MVKAITPQEVILKRQIPECIFSAINQLIIANFDGKKAVVYQKDILNIVVNCNLTRDEIFKKNYLDIEPFYREAGWKVIYDSPAYCENYDAFFTFIKKNESN